MKTKKIVVVGGVAGGASFAARMRRLDEFAEIILLEKGPYVSFANCGLPYYVGGVIQDRDALIIQSPEKLQSVFNIDVRVNSEVMSIDTKAKEVAVKKLPPGEIYRESYDYLVLSPGAQPIRPPIPGIEESPVFTVRSIPDVDAITDYIKTRRPKSAAIIGGGYIGLEMADNLHKLGLKVSIVEKAPQIIGTMDYDMAAIISGHLLAKGVRLYLEDGVAAFEKKADSTEVVLESGRRLDTDMVILAIGVKPDTDFLKDSGIELGLRGSIKVNASMQTNIPSVYAVGDATEVIDFNSGMPTLVPLAGPANKQGRIAADNIAGLQSTYQGTQGTAIAKVFNLTAASTGDGEKSLQARKIRFLTAVALPTSHSAYYPGSTPLTIKLHFSPEGKILGVQIVGEKGVDKRIDVLATALRQGLTVYDLQELELAYAPPFGAAKDPVNMVGYIAENMLAGRMEAIYLHDIITKEKDCFILDVREKWEVEKGKIANSYHIPLGSLRERLHELPKDENIIVCCQVGKRAYVAACILRQRGYRAKVLAGGYSHYAAVTKALSAIEKA
ncbi:MAG: FAD-dependent oxidoreductase [Bacillota bacterium]|nr:FAD-dependent oxidoreductase [Bacillota bacterium]